jgi:hypothetical protein
MSHLPRVRAANVAGRLQDPYDFLAEMFSPPPLPNDAEIALILARTPPEDLIIGMDKQPNGEYSPTHFILPRH